MGEGLTNIGAILRPRDPAPQAERATQKGVTVLAEATRLISADRRGAYGEAIEDFRATAIVWSVILIRRGLLVEGSMLEARDVALLMAGLKLSREAHQHKTDNCVDGAGYFALAEEVAP